VRSEADLFSSMGQLLEIHLNVFYKKMGVAMSGTVRLRWRCNFRKCRKLEKNKENGRT
jgi:hypothetical protein